MDDVKDHEKKKEDLKKFIDSLESACRVKYGPFNRIDISSDPYRDYTSVRKFKDTTGIKSPKKIKGFCKFMSGTYPDKDKNNRYYTKAKFEKECNQVQGAWDETAINRHNKYDIGNCWVNEENKTCGSAIKDPKVLRVAYNKFFPEETYDSILKTKKNCEEIPSCEFKQMTAYTYDCVPKNESSSEKDKIYDPFISTPPEDMPLSEFEAYLENWYLNNYPSPAPKTSSLIGKGNRCKNEVQEEEKKKTPSPEAPSAVDIIHFRNLDYNKPENLDLIRNMGIKLNQYQITFLQNKDRAMYINENENLFEKLDSLQFDKDYKYVPPKVKILKKLESQMLPNLPQSLINMVLKQSVIKNTNKRGILAWHSTGAGKCHAIDTPILMFDGKIKLVQDIVVGDLLMGDDSKPRKVLALGRGQDIMYDIIPENGEKYTVNSEHILCLKYKENDSVHHISVKDYIELDEDLKSEFCSYRTAVDFMTQHIDINPYYYSQMICRDTKNSKIPYNYLINNRYSRLKVLAGIIDMFGILDMTVYRLYITNKDLLNDTVFLSRSLGFRVNILNNNSISIEGNIFQIPTKKTVNQIEDFDIFIDRPNPLHVEFTVQKVGLGDYYGFTLDGNHRYVMGDFTVTHNTAVATGVMDAFWDSDKKIIFVSSNDAIASNPDFVFHKLAMTFFGRFKKPPFIGVDENETLKKIQLAFKKRNVRFLSFARLANRISPTHRDHINLDECVLIIDEVHNLFRPLANQRKQHELLESHLIGKKFKHPKMKVVILTATPGDNVRDVLKLINIVRDYGTPEITAPNYNDSSSIKKFKNQIRGLISFLDMSSDDTKFPKIIDQAPVRLPLSDKQTKKYMEAYKTVKDAQKNYEELLKKNALDKYWAPARKYANSLFTFEKKMSLDEFSSKIPQVLALLQKYPSEKHYLYSSFYTKMGYGGHGVIAIAKTLNDQGYEMLTYQDAKKYNKSGKLPPPKKRYILVINTELGTQAGANLHELLKIYNHPENKNGELIHVMLASNKYNESIDLKDVSHVHLFEPLVTMAAEKQAIGRAVRFCSFANKDRSKGEWKVLIHRYLMDLPAIDMSKAKNKVENIDQKILDDSREKFKELFTIYNCMKESAIDCRLLKEFHSLTSGQEIQCEF